jgi:hypothetical protein
MKTIILLFVLLGFFVSTSAQYKGDEFMSIAIENSTDLIKPNLLSNHPLGMYISRINHNFKIRSAEKYSLSFEVSSANVMLPYVKSYELTDQSHRNLAAGVAWYNREFLFNLSDVPSKVKEFTADGIIRSYKFNFSHALSKNHELHFGLRSYSLDKGKYPFSFFTSDESIEWFHSNIAGGEDPFSRRHYGLNKAEISYKDENNNFVTMHNGDFRIAGIELSYFYYPKLKINKKKQIYLNFGTHFGVNISKYNPVADIGFSSSVIKKLVVRDKNILTVGLSAGALRQRFIKFGDRVNISNQTVLYSFEGLLDYKKKLQNNNTISYGLNYAFQTSYNNKNDFEHIILTGQRLRTHWQQTLSHLYNTLEGWNIICTYSVNKFSYFIYAREDLKLDNAPDIQTGFGLKIALK